MKFRPYVKFRSFRHHTAGVAYTPKQLASVYGFPTGFSGSGKNVAVIELGGAYSQTDLNAYFKSLGLTVKPVIFHSIQGATNASDPNVDPEVMLDLCIIGGMAPGVQLHCYMAPNSDAGFLGAIQQAITDKMDCISISWGGPEDIWASSTIFEFNAAFQRAAAAGITVTAACGDGGSSDGESGNHVDFPSSSPYVLGCGGTSLLSAAPISEVVWNSGGGEATGGGVSALFTTPTWQSKSNVPGGKARGVPDVAGCADPDTGWSVIVDGQTMVVGGTSAVAPMWAALAAILGQALGKNIGFLNASLYSLAGWGRDIVTGNNGTYIARVGYDCCTGQGVPVGTKLLAALAPTPGPSGPTGASGPSGVPTGPSGPSGSPSGPSSPVGPSSPASATKTIVVTGTDFIVTVNGKTV
jgi:kumamolisin